MIDNELIKYQQDVVVESDPLKLELEDDEFVDVIDQYISDFDGYYAEKRLTERQNKNIDYYLGKQVRPEDATSYQVPFVENVVYEGIRRIKPIATSRLPDLTVKQGPSGNKQSAEQISDLINSDIKKRDNRKLLGMAHVHEQLFFYATLKARWNPEKGDDGDYEFINVFPLNMFWDHTCKTNNADDMRFVGEYADLSTKEICMMFPKKADEFLDYLGVETKNAEFVRTEKGMATTRTIQEVWFHWYKETTDPDTKEKKWEKIHGVVWKYKDFVLAKMKNPYFDFEGKPQLFNPEIKEKGLPTENELKQMLFGESTQVRTVYNNYFKNPRKPYFFMVYESIGQDPIDATNRVEQILPFQDHINKEGTQIIGMNERSAGKPVFNSDALDKKTVEKIDWANYKQALSVNGDDIGKAFTHIEMPAAPAQLYTAKKEDRAIAFEMLGVNATTRGVQESGDQTLGEAQMFREADYGFIDDLVEDTINDAAEWMAQWSMQFIKLFYTKKHFVDAVGKDGEALQMEISQDLIEDGMAIEVSASGVDKMMRKRMAVENAKLGYSDPVSYFIDTDQSNAKERARMAFLFKFAPMQYYQEFVAPEQQQGVPGPVQMMPPGNPPMPGMEPQTIVPPQAQTPTPTAPTQQPNP